MKDSNVTIIIIISGGGGGCSSSSSSRNSSSGSCLSKEHVHVTNMSPWFMGIFDRKIALLLLFFLYFSFYSKNNFFLKNPCIVPTCLNRHF